MTRINLISVEDLSDQHLMAEYRELPRMASFALKTRAKAEDIPRHYKLGSGHMMFFLDKATFLEQRHAQLRTELLYRGFRLTNLEPFKMPRVFEDKADWSPSYRDIEISWERIKSKINAKPTFYRWSRK